MNFSLEILLSWPKNFFTHTFLGLPFILALAGLAFYWLFLQAKRLPAGRARFLLYKASAKSPTSAVLLGGLPFTLLLMASIVYLLEVSPAYLLESEKALFKLSIMGFSLITVYGYLDDLFEIRPIIKLSFQFFIIFLYAFFAAPVLHRWNTTLPFIALMAWGIVLLNGANLLDGLDTMSAKIAAATLAMISLFSIVWGNGLTLPYFSLICASLLFGFYFYNRHPSRIYLGEIGSSALGFLYLHLSSMLYLDISSKHKKTEAAMMAIIPCMIFFIEASVSFCRRLLNRRSPFRGDRLHLHHILVDVKKLGVQTSSTVMGLIQWLPCLTTFALSCFLSPLPALIWHTFFLLGIYFLLGHRSWFQQDAVLADLLDFQRFLKKKDVIILTPDLIDSFEFEILEQGATSEGPNSADRIKPAA